MKQRLSYFYCTWFYSGLLPWAPGTWGTLAAIPVWLFMQKLNIVFYFGIVILLLSLGIIASNYLEQALDVSDPGFIVIDEVVGFLIAAYGVNSFTKLLFAFLLFRLFDIMKPWPISWLEQNLSSGWAVMLDDVAAGVITFLTLLSF